MRLSKQDRIAVFQDTQERLENNPELKRLTNDAINNTQLYRDGYVAEDKASYSDCSISVVADCTFEAAEVLAKKHAKVAVLNFASATRPGGGVANGASAQEEYLCRLSNLYACLSKREIYDDFYHYHILNHLLMKNTLYSDRVIYSKGITVFKKHTEFTRYTDAWHISEKEEYTDDWFHVDVITSPAPNLRHGAKIDNADLDKLLRKRIINFLEIAAGNGAEALVLGAYGCGAFKNPPEIVSGAFRGVLLDGGYASHFAEIVFAIRKLSEPYCPNLTAFEEAFMGIPLYGKER